ncbi:MAG TPA: DUF4397 domain-containing protein [Haloplasmataceae bacterium]
MYKSRVNIKIYDSLTERLLYNETISIPSNKYHTISIINDQGKVDLIVVSDSVNRHYRKDNKTLKVIDAFNNMIDVVVDSGGMVVVDVVDQVNNFFIEAGSEVKRIVDRFGNTIDVIVDKAGVIIAIVFEELTGALEDLIVRIGDGVEKIVDEFGNDIDVVIDEFDNIIGWVINDIEDVENSDDTLIPKDIRFNQNNAQIRLIHLSENLPAINLTLTDKTKIFVDTKFKQKTNYTPISTNINDLQLRLNSNDQVLLTIPNINIQPGKSYTLYVIGLLGGTPPLEGVLTEDL